MRQKAIWGIVVFLVVGSAVSAWPAETAESRLDAASAPVESAADVGATPQPAAPPRDPLLAAYHEFCRGGTVMWVILGASVIGLTFVLERLVGLRRSVHVVPRLVEDVLIKTRREGVDAGRLLLQGQAAALARVIDAILMRKGANRPEMERVLDDEAGRVLWDMRLNLRPIGIVATIAPLLGLLGTVQGLIMAFATAAEKGMDDPRNFAEGIYVALYTTAFGLAVAIPFIIFYHYLRGKADVIMREVEDQGIRFIIEYDAQHREALPVVPSKCDSSPIEGQMNQTFLSAIGSHNAPADERG